MEDNEKSWKSIPGPDPGDGAPLAPLRESGVLGEEKGRLRLRLLPLRGLERPLKCGEPRRSLLSLPRLFSGSSGGRALGPPPRSRLSRPSTASSRLGSRLPFLSNKDKSVLSVTPCNPRPPPWGELLAMGVLTERGGEDRRLGIHNGGGVALQRREKSSTNVQQRLSNS